jgi:hypothetical protein
MVKLKTDAEEPQDVAAEAFGEALMAIRDEIRGIRTGKITPKEHDKASRIAWLASKATTIAAELRKAEAAANAATKKISIDTLVAWAKLQTREVRAKLVTAIGALDSSSRKSVLG